MKVGAFFGRYKKEVIITSLLLLISVISLIAVSVFMPVGARVEVRLDGELIAEYPLSENGEYSLLDGANILVIEDGKAYMKDANCPDRVCVITGKISLVGETVVCLPHRLSVTVVKDGTDGPEIVPGAP